jgi:hypothetical protein
MIPDEFLANNCPGYDKITYDKVQRHIPYGFYRYFYCWNEKTNSRVSYSFICSNYGAPELKYERFLSYNKTWNIIKKFAIDLKDLADLAGFEIDPKITSDSHNVYRGDKATNINLKKIFKDPEIIQVNYYSLLSFIKCFCCVRCPQIIIIVIIIY